MVIGSGSTDRYLDTKELGELVERAVETIPVKAERVLVIIPDGTRPGGTFNSRSRTERARAMFQDDLPRLTAQP